MASDPHTGIRHAVAELRASITRAASEVEAALSASESKDAQARMAQMSEHQELSRRLAALRGRVEQARELAEPHEQRAELATLLYFARMLREDARAWRGTAHQALAALERQELAARQEQVRRASEHERLLRRREELQTRIDSIAAQMARSTGECRKTVPVIKLAETVTVSSITVSGPRRRFRPSRLWLVTLSPDRDQVLVSPE